MELAEDRIAWTNPFIPGKFFQNDACKYMPFLPFLLALWLPGGLQVWGIEGWGDGDLESYPLQPIQPRWI